MDNEPVQPNETPVPAPVSSPELSVSDVSTTEPVAPVPETPVTPEAIPETNTDTVIDAPVEEGDGEEVEESPVQGGGVDREEFRSQ